MDDKNRPRTLLCWIILVWGSFLYSAAEDQPFNCTGRCGNTTRHGSDGRIGQQESSIVAGVVVGVLVVLVFLAILIVFFVQKYELLPHIMAACTRLRSWIQKTWITRIRSYFGNGTVNDDPTHSGTLATDPEQPKPPKPCLKVKPTIMNSSDDTPGTATADDSLHVYFNAALDAVSLSTTAAQSQPQGEPSQPSKRRKSKRDSQTAGKTSKNHGAGRKGSKRGNSEENSPLDENSHVYDDSTNRADFEAVQNILMDRLASEQLEGEFSKIKGGVEDTEHEAGMLPKNFRKNRFESIIPYDQSRVVLSDRYKKERSTDYINASYISGYNSPKQFIAAQGPKVNTVGDLWRMIWQEKTTHIVMLTNIKEKGRDKCEQYWPEDEGSTETYGPVTVATDHVERRNDFYIRTFTVTRDESDETRTVTQYHYISWTDHGVPKVTSLVSFWRHIRNMTKSSSGESASAPPIVVHCSAGVGRTGTYIGLDIGMDLAVKEGKIDVLGLINRLRNERCHMVQALDQYVFLHQALLEAYTAHGTNISLDHFEAIFPPHEQITSEASQLRVDKEFLTLLERKSTDPEPRHDSAMLEENLDKNRDPHTLPSEDHLVYLTEHTRGRNQYINAVFMPTLRDSRGRIVTQLPLPSTQVDFWRLVFGNDVTTIVSLSTPNEKQEVTYWPTKEGNTLTTDPYEISLHSKTRHKGSKITSYNLDLKKKNVRLPRLVQLLHYKGWTGEVGGNTSDILHLIDTLLTSQMNTDDHRLVVQCSDGVGKSGLFCALYDIISRMTYDHEVDVFMTVRQVQQVASTAVTSVVQYRYCYEVAQSQTRKMSVYANS
ncbi:hypothetical protein V1264_020609 [Littorina saxatilis]|uniref:protein-tyrosine-phosphatase n=2 Tax=Littorina saxatilis TaxID=31220 RepID=A0AAN9BC51_9CAEN